MSAIDVLRAVEWAGEGQETKHGCPNCGAPSPRYPGGGQHRDGCALAAALQAPDPVAEEREACARVAEAWADVVGAAASGIAAAIVALVSLALVGCDRAIVTVTEGHDGPRGPAGEAGPPGPVGAPGEPGTPAVTPGARLRPEWHRGDDGARSWAGSWRDTEREESCRWSEPVPGEWRCLPVYRSQTAFAAWANPTCDGLRAGPEIAAAYVLETSTATLYQDAGPLATAWGLGETGACMELGGAGWVAWAPVDLDAFVGADITAD